jgi:hypothetical protein
MVLTRDSTAKIASGTSASQRRPLRSPDAGPSSRSATAGVST